MRAVGHIAACSFSGGWYIIRLSVAAKIMTQSRRRNLATVAINPSLVQFCRKTMHQTVWQHLTQTANAASCLSFNDKLQYNTGQRMSFR